MLRNFFKYLSIREFILFWKALTEKRALIKEMVMNDFRKAYFGSFLGILWAFVQPVIFILVMWFVFSVGLRQGRSQDQVPFVLWLMPGMFFWFFLSDGIQNGTRAVIENSFLVKKVRFRVSILPLVKILSGMIVHVFFIILVFVVLIFHGIWPQLSWIQTAYYLLATMILSLGICWITSSTYIFVKDVAQIVQVIIRVGFWLTPIFWRIEALGDGLPVLKTLIKLNPAYYLVQGYRDSILYGKYFWNRPWVTLYFWSITTVIFITGAVVFRKLRPHFADVM